MRPGRAVLTVALGIFAMAGEVAAQETQFVPTLREGDTLKVWAVRPRLNGTVGILAGLRADTLTLGQLVPTVPPGQTSVPYAALRRIDVRRGTHRSTGRIVTGTLLGVAAGALLGAAIGPAIECGNDCSGYYEGVIGAIAGFGIGGIAGGVTGGILGARRVPKWEPVTLRR